MTNKGKKSGHYNLKRLLKLRNAMKIIVCIPFLLWISCTPRKISAPAPVFPIPSPEQFTWHNLEFYAFIHCSINTFTDKEWGFGDENPKLFNPDSLDVKQWVDVFKEVGMKAVIITAKHHDGFCLWPSAFTEHSIKNSLYKNGRGDILKELSDACKKVGLKFGIYLSPWDRNHSRYGHPEYIDYYRNQLKEIFTNYGPVFEMWFDGANGGDGFYGGSNEVRRIDRATYYNWPGTIKMVQEMEPKILFFSDAGPDIRWVGNERGIAGQTNWNTISADTLYAGKPGITELLNTGSEEGINWIPAEVDVSIRPGWFYHESEDTKVKTPEELFAIYLTSVGRGSNLLLNVPPDKHGRIAKEDIRSLRGLKELLDEKFSRKIVASHITSSNYRGNSKNYRPENLIDSDYDTFWSTDEVEINATIEIGFEDLTEINFIVIKETIQLGQRIKKFTIEAKVGADWKKVAEGTTIGYKRILPLAGIQTNKLRIKVVDAKACPVISEIEIY
jgi:alpha-L-fucosidase